ncbi:MAG: permease-like cell division protein FtsX [Actinomycetia bacterium]|nr:permease-like cell division protein FtsX [Actinomycetes bacterium]
MRLRTCGYVVREAGRGLTYSGWMSLASVTIVAVALFVFAVFGVLGLNINQAAQTLNRQAEVRVFFDPGLSRSAEAGILTQVDHWPGVRSTRYFTKAQALAQLRREFPNDQDLWRLLEQGNPLYDGFDLYATRADVLPDVAKRLTHLAGIHQVEYQALVVRRLMVVTQVLRDVGYGIETLLGVATLFIIANTIRLGLFARRREIAVMKLVGATDWFIRWPFLLEGILLGLIGAGLADAAVWFGYRWVTEAAGRTLAFWPLVPATVVIRTTGMATAVAGAAMGLLGSLWAVHRFLRV